MDHYGFKTFGCMRRDTPEAFPQGLLWETKRKNNNPKGTILAIRCVGFNPDYEDEVSNDIRSDIRKHFAGQPCIISGTKADVQLDHRAGDKLNPLHQSALIQETQKIDDFMPLCRVLNDVKREACKKCVLTRERPPLPPFLGGGPMRDGPGCHGCFWFTPEIYA